MIVAYLYMTFERARPCEWCVVCLSLSHTPACKHTRVPRNITRSVERHASHSWLAPMMLRMISDVAFSSASVRQSVCVSNTKQVTFKGFRSLALFFAMDKTRALSCVVVYHGYVERVCLTMTMLRVCGLDTTSARAEGKKETRAERLGRVVSLARTTHCLRAVVCTLTHAHTEK